MTVYYSRSDEYCEKQSQDKCKYECIWIPFKCVVKPMFNDGCYDKYCKSKKSRENAIQMCVNGLFLQPSQCTEDESLKPSNIDTNSDHYGEQPVPRSGINVGI